MTFRSWASAKAGISQSALAGRIGSPLLNPVTSSLSVSMIQRLLSRSPRLSETVYDRDSNSKRNASHVQRGSIQIIRDF